MNLLWMLELHTDPFLEPIIILKFNTTHLFKVLQHADFLVDTLLQGKFYKRYLFCTCASKSQYLNSKLCKKIEQIIHNKVN